MIEAIVLFTAIVSVAIIARALTHAIAKVLRDIIDEDPEKE